MALLNALAACGQGICEIKVSVYIVTVLLNTTLAEMLCYFVSVPLLSQR